MQRVSAGYTVIEALIFLAVSGFLITISFLFLNGQEANTRFAQSMRDMNSKVQDWINDIPNGFVGQQSYSNVSCQVVNGPLGSSAAHPKIQNGGGSNKGDCIFLGKVLQFTDSGTSNAGQASTVYAYSVFGQRDYIPVGEVERPVANMVETNPIAAVGIPGYSGDTDFTEAYFIKGGAKVKSIVKSSGVKSDQSHLGGFFLSFNQPFIKSNGTADLRAYQYPIPGNRDPGNVSTGSYMDIDGCISINSAGSVDCSSPSVADNGNWPRPLTDWEICFNNQGNDETGLLTITSSGGQGVTTKMEIKPC